MATVLEPPYYILLEKDLWGIVSGDEREPVFASITEAQKERY